MKQTPNTEPRRIVQVSCAATDHLIQGGHNYVVAALCNDGSLFIASATNAWQMMLPIPQPVQLPEKD